MFVFAACSLVEHSGVANCTSMNGTWYNHTCFSESEVELSNITLNILNDTKSIIKAKSPSDEYFQ